MPRSCYGCFYEIYRKCYWFLDTGNNDAPKAIPSDILDKGCDKYKNTSIGYNSGDKLTDKIIKTFDGEIISSKYERPTYKRKYVKSPHNYAYRKDAQ